MAAKKAGLLGDYEMLDKMSKELKAHQKNAEALNRRIVKKVHSDLKEGLVESINELVTHMENARKELEKAKKEIKRI